MITNNNNDIMYMVYGGFLSHRGIPSSHQLEYFFVWDFPA